MPTRTGLDRRNFLSLSAAAGLIAGVPGAALARGTAPTRRFPAKARNVIFMVSDGMSTGTLTLAHAVRVARDGKRSHWVDLWSRPGVRRAAATTHSADSLVTDSAAGATAWGIGEHVNNDAVNFTPDNRTPTPILLHARQFGKRTGLVTTARITHATPAGFSTNSPKRSFEEPIAKQQLERGYDVLLGGGHKHFSQELLDQHKDVRVVRTQQELADAGPDGRILGLFARDHVPYYLDRPPECPSLPTMTRAALDRLSRGPDGFVLQIEGGRIDHAAHDNDAASLIAEQLDFDDSIATVVEWMGDRDDTLLVVTTDHGNANPGLTVYGPEGSKGLEKLHAPRKSFEWIWQQIPKEIRKDGAALTKLIPDLAEQATGIRITDEETALVVGSFLGKRVHPSDLMGNKPLNILGAALSNYTGVCFLSPNHTADLVEVTAVGPGAETLPPFIDNIDLHGLMVRTLGLGPAAPVEIGQLQGPPPKPD